MKHLHNLVITLALLLALGSSPARSQVIDLEGNRQQLTSIAANWSFHAGDDPRWAQPGFDDKGWKLIQPATGWIAQGYKEQNGLAWFRFRLLVPAHSSSIVVQIPRIDKSYQLFANGRLIAQLGHLPPEVPNTVTGSARVYTLPVAASAQPQQIVLALRLWQESRLVGIRANVLLGRAYAGDPGTVQRQFALGKAAALLSRGSEYTQDIVLLLVGAATLVLFFFTRQDLYLWLAFSSILGSATLAVRFASQHFAWNFLLTLYAYIVIDALIGITYTLFLLAAFEVRTWKLTLLVIALVMLAEAGPVLLILDRIRLIWADGLYFVFDAAVQILALWFLVRAARRGSVDARLLLFPVLVGALLAASGNLGHWLVDFQVPHAERLLTTDIEVLTDPFRVSLSDLGNVLATLGTFSVLVYRFARTSREQQRLSAALRAAHDIQHELVPVEIPTLGGLQTQVVYLAAEEVGGDFCQVLPRRDGSILVAIGDVSGKGLQAAMLGTLAVGALRSVADEDVEPAQVLDRLNAVLLRTEHAGFITCMVLKLAADGEITIANAGHLAPYLNGAELPVGAGLPLGLLAEIEYEQSSFLLPSTARLTLLSDGVVEARSRSGELFGFERTSDISQLSASAIAAAAYRHGQEDDITVITLDWQEPCGDLCLKFKRSGRTAQTRAMLRRLGRGE